MRLRSACSHRSETDDRKSSFGNAVASLCVEKKGAIPAMPELLQVEERLENAK